MNSSERKRKISTENSEELSSSDNDSDANEPILIEDSESESESECDDWDLPCSKAILPLQVPSNASVCGFHLRESKDDNQNKKKRSVKPEMRIGLQASDEQLKEGFNKIAPLKIDNLELITDPFPLCIIKNFLEDESFLKEVRDEFFEIEWNRRSMDLYEFFQSEDLKNANLAYTKMLYDFLKTSVMPWVASLTGLELSEISATCSLYTDTDYLLVHDDQQGTRQVAYVLYLTSDREWIADNGGALQVFSKDSQGHPMSVIRDILPAHNQFIFFPVSPDSFHKVAEVTCKDECRMSINGWFHGPKDKKSTDVRPELHSDIIKINPEVVPNIDLEAWVCDTYLKSDVMSEIQNHIEEDSEISLKNFFNIERFSEILFALQETDLKWRESGPPTRRFYETLANEVDESLPGIIESFLKLFRATQMFELLKKYTDLELTSMHYELQRWSPGCYSLLSDYDWGKKKNELDVMMYLGSSSRIVGGQTQYVSLDEQIQNALVTVEPEENNLNIVFRDTARFTKYVSKQSDCKYFYLLIASYSE